MFDGMQKAFESLHIVDTNRVSVEGNRPHRRERLQASRHVDPYRADHRSDVVLAEPAPRETSPLAVASAFRARSLQEELGHPRRRGLQLQIVSQRDETSHLVTRRRHERQRHGGFSESRPLHRIDIDEIKTDVVHGFRRNDVRSRAEGRRRAEHLPGVLEDF